MMHTLRHIWGQETLRDSGEAPTVTLSSPTPPRAAFSPSSSRRRRRVLVTAERGVSAVVACGLRGGSGCPRRCRAREPLTLPASIRPQSPLGVPILMDKKQTSLGTPVYRTNPFDSDSDSEVPSRPSRAHSVPVRRTDQSMQELEDYAVDKAEETSRKVNDCVRAAEAIREDATKTLVTLHRQGEQITRTHRVAADIEHDLSMSEKLLGSLGGLFSKTWKPKRNQQIKGPISQNNSFTSSANHMEQRQRLGISSTHEPSSNQVHRSPATAIEKVQVEIAKQDDALSDLSNMLGELKGMALDMGTEIERQNKSLDAFGDDVDELNFRVKGANQRGRRLLGK
uniref:t-SNARE coiled-coil homology domain-containing protein n=1 Tax=Oryza punctata TaxID=4537 RepID=A0A0E0KAF7_ORYPU